MWVRIPSFPPEYYNFKSINTILEFNNVGTLLKLDPNAPKRSWAKFARFCINLDCSKSINKQIVIPDEQGNMRKFNLWFEDIPQGCGNCGAGDHMFNSCPFRKFIPPKLKITFKKPSSVHPAVHIPETDDSGWRAVGNKSKNQAGSSAPNQEDKGKKLEEYGGTGVIYITDDSSNESQTGILSDAQQADPTSTAPFGEFSPGNNKNQDDMASPEYETMGIADPNAFLLPTTIEQGGAMANQQYYEEFTKEKELAEAENNLYYYQEDGNEVWEEGQGDGIFEDIPYEEGTLEANLNYNTLHDLPLEDNSFHSLNSDNSMIKHLAEMELPKAGQSTSGSGKRKTYGGEGDTASSDLLGVKKPKI